MKAMEEGRNCYLSNLHNVIKLDKKAITNKRVQPRFFGSRQPHTQKKNLTLVRVSFFFWLLPRGPSPTPTEPPRSHHVHPPIRMTPQQLRRRVYELQSRVEEQAGTTPLRIDCDWTTGWHVIFTGAGMSCPFSLGVAMYINARRTQTVDKRFKLSSCSASSGGIVGAAALHTHRSGDTEDLVTQLNSIHGGRSLASTITDGVINVASILATRTRDHPATDFFVNYTTDSVANGPCRREVNIVALDDSDARNALLTTCHLPVVGLTASGTASAYAGCFDGITPSWDASTDSTTLVVDSPWAHWQPTTLLGLPTRHRTVQLVESGAAAAHEFFTDTTGGHAPGVCRGDQWPWHRRIFWGTGRHLMDTWVYGHRLACQSRGAMRCWWGWAVCLILCQHWSSHPNSVQPLFVQGLVALAVLSSLAAMPAFVRTMLLVVVGGPVLTTWLLGDM
jgi:hypothetical protein